MAPHLVFPGLCTTRWLWVIARFFDFMQDSKVRKWKPAQILIEVGCRIPKKLCDNLYWKFTENHRYPFALWNFRSLKKMSNRYKNDHWLLTSALMFFLPYPVFTWRIETLELRLECEDFKYQLRFMCWARTIQNFRPPTLQRMSSSCSSLKVASKNIATSLRNQT